MNHELGNPISKYMNRLDDEALKLIVGWMGFERLKDGQGRQNTRFTIKASISRCILRIDHRSDTLKIPANKSRRDCAKFLLEALGSLQCET
jgi:hypothetical protein